MRIPSRYATSLLGIITLAYVGSAYAGGAWAWAGLIPGLFIMFVATGYLVARNLGLKTERPAELAVYSVGLSVGVLMVLGLILNTGLGLLGVTHPLARPYVLTGLTTTTLMLGWLASVRKIDVGINLRLRRPSWSSVWLYGVPPVLTTIAIMGAVSLNNGGTNYLALLALGGLGAYAAALLLRRKPVPASVYPVSLFFLCLTLLLAISLRGWQISGHDILAEYHVFQLTKANLRWDMNFFRDAYNACLSITLLPTMLSQMLPIPDHYLYRILYQVFFAVTPVALFLFANRYLATKYAYLATLLFMVQAPFLRDFPYLIRQEVAIMFFVLILLALFSRVMSTRTRHVLFIVFGLFMILSHYSTTYVAVGVFGAAFVIDSFMRLSGAPGLRCLRLPSPPSLTRLIGRVGPARGEHLVQAPTGRTHHLVSGWFVATLFIGTFAWNTVITHTSGNLSAFTKKSVSEAQVKPTVTEVPKKSSGLLNQFSLGSDSGEDDAAAIRSYAAVTRNTLTSSAIGVHYNPSTYAAYDPVTDQKTSLPANLDRSSTSALYIAGEIGKKAVKVSILVGIIWLVLSYRRVRSVDRDIVVLILAAAAILAAALVLPVVSVEYDVLRAYQQLLAILVIPAIIGAIVLTRPLRRFATVALTTVFLTYFAFVTPLAPQLIGSGDSHLQLNNAGLYYNLYYTHRGEVLAGGWINDRANPDVPTYADWYATKRLTAFSTRTIYIHDNVLPHNITRDSYVLVDYTNLKTKTAYVFYNGHETNYAFPTEFLDVQKDTIYSNGQARIMR